MQEKIQEIHQQVDTFVIENKDQLEAFRIAYVGRKSVIGELFDGLKNVPAEQRREIGQELNGLKDFAQNKFNEIQALLEASSDNSVSIEFDLTLPVVPQENGTLHPLSVVRARIIEIFEKMGFNVSDGPEIETDFYNFTALNFPPEHPARQEHDTFFMNRAEGDDRPPHVLRTHTSPVQIRALMDKGAPIRVIAPGRVYRMDMDQTHTPMFHQVEGLAIDRDISMANLKWTLEEFCRAFFEVDKVELRFRASHFPFTEPSAEVDIRCSWEGGQLKIGQGDKWMEILGSGMVHPKVLAAAGVNPDEWQGFAFGMGIDRIAMLKYGMPDLRDFFNADVRWMSHYGFRPLDMPTLFGGLSG